MVTFEMKSETIHKMVALGEKLQHVFVATADRTGMPHVAAAGKISLVSDEQVAVTAWFCPGTTANLEENRKISIVAWDASADTGYQLLGEVVTVQEGAYLNGYMPESEGAQLPQVERKLIVRVRKIIAFSHAPHSDVEE
jgi:predicted pyridoxine 5'-phosphate oxidase superfamily flavin-nucleotide-binding protein